MRKLLLVFFVLTSQYSYGQDPSPKGFKSKQDSLVYIKEVQSFIRYIHKERIKDSTYVLINEAELKLICEKPLESDTLFSDDEKNIIHKQLKNQKIKSWKSIWPYKIKYLSSEKLRETYILNNSINWIAFKKDIGTSYYIVSSPVFLRNYNFCIYYEANYSDSSNVGIIKLYKKAGSNWILEKSVCSWADSWDFN
jgi:hypothetical protein